MSYCAAAPALAIVGLCTHTLGCRFDLLQKAGLKPDRVTYNTLLKCCMRNCLPDKALDLHKQMSQFGIPVRCQWQLLSADGVPVFWPNPLFTSFLASYCHACSLRAICNTLSCALDSANLSVAAVFNLKQHCNWPPNAQFATQHARCHHASFLFCSVSVSHEACMSGLS